MERLICIAIGYACGLFQTAYILGKIYHIDIRKQGSGNLGSTNVLRTLGKKAGALNLLCDCLKCIAAILIVRAIFGNSYGDILPLLSLYAAAGCILVLGAGSWGTALSILLYNNGHEVILWSALGEEITTLREKREHVSKLPGVKIPEPIDITIDLERSLRDTDVAILAVPSPYTRSTCKRMAPFVKNGQKIVNVAKGVEEKTLLTLSEIIEQELPQANVSVLSGPSHAEEDFRLPVW